MDSVKQILESEGVGSIADMEMNETYEINGLDMDLTIEKVGEHRVSVAHYYRQRGDLMRDPEIVFDTSNGDWTPVEYTQDNLGVYQHDETGLDGVDGFVNQWDRNLRKQGYVPNGGGQ